jgi:hypothetical protein
MMASFHFWSHGEWQGGPGNFEYTS